MIFDRSLDIIICCALRFTNKRFYPAKWRIPHNYLVFEKLSFFFTDVWNQHAQILPPSVRLCLLWYGKLKLEYRDQKSMYFSHFTPLLIYQFMSTTISISRCLVLPTLQFLLWPPIWGKKWSNVCLKYSKHPLGNKLNFGKNESKCLQQVRDCT